MSSDIPDSVANCESEPIVDDNDFVVPDDNIAVVSLSASLDISETETSTVVELVTNLDDSRGFVHDVSFLVAPPEIAATSAAGSSSITKPGDSEISKHQSTPKPTHRIFQALAALEKRHRKGNVDFVPGTNGCQHTDCGRRIVHQLEKPEN